MKRTAAVIVTYNRKDLLVNCVNAVLGQSTKGMPDVIIIDNGSRDGTSDLFTGQDAVFDHDRIHYFNAGMNTGGAGGFCLGIRKAAELGYDYVWLMDDDCIPSESALEELLDYAESHEGSFGFLSSKVLWKDGSICRMNLQRETMFRLVEDMNREHIAIKMASFVSLFIPMKVIRDIGLPYREFYIWTDDWEYTRRISRKYQCMLITASEVTHYSESDAKADISAAVPERLDRFRYLYRNDVFLYRREGLKGIAYEAVRLPAHILRIALSDNSAAEKLRRAGIVISGTLDGISFYPTPEKLGPSVKISLSNQRYL